jgi:predicted amidohydrolase
MEGFMKSMELRIASLAVKSEPWALDRNVKSIGKLVLDASKEGASIVCTPELALQGYFLPERGKEEEYHAIAEPLDGPHILELSKLALEQEIYLAIGFLEIFEGKMFNSMGLLNPSGKCEGVYRKVHLGKEESKYFYAGDQFQVFETAYGKIGLMTCFDRQFPETTRSLSLKGARLILNASAGGYGEWNQAMMRTRAYENKAYILFSHPMECFVVDPFGDIIGLKGQNESYIVRKIDLAFVDELRSEQCSYYKDIPELFGRWRNPFEYRRPDIY